MGVTVVNYHADNGVFNAMEFQDELIKMEQGMSFSGGGAHHMNAMAECGIGSVVAMARTMMLHAKLRWPKAVTTKLWPMALKHAQHLINHVPNHNNVCPMDLVLKTTVPRTALRNLHVWGCPSFVLDPKLQDGGHIPKFDPKSRRGLHLGWSPMHASTVPLVLNLSTGNVSPQFHIVFDDWFSTVNSEEQSLEDHIDDKEWTELFMGSRFQIFFDEDDPMELDDEWLSEMERVAKHQRAVARVQAQMPVPTGNVPPAVDVPVIDPTGNDPWTTPHTDVVLPDNVPVAPPSLQPSTEQRELPSQRESASKQPPKVKREVRMLGGIEGAKDGQERTRSTRSRPPAGHFKGMVAGMIGMLGNRCLMAMAASTVANSAAQVALQSFDAVTQTFDDVECHTYQALVASKAKGRKGVDPDFPTFHQAMLSPEVELWKESMREELKILVEMNTWTVVPRTVATSKGLPVFRTTWAFRQKRDPAGLATKKKARLCLQGDQMKRLAKRKEIEEFPSYSPVVQWSTVRLMLILSIIHKLETRQVWIM